MRPVTSADWQRRLSYDGCTEAEGTLGDGSDREINRVWVEVSDQSELWSAGKPIKRVFWQAAAERNCWRGEDGEGESVEE